MESTISAVTEPPRVAQPRSGSRIAPRAAGSRGSSFGELWSFRELALVLALRDLKVRYKQTVIGVAWVVVQPLAAAAIFTIVFGRLAGLPSEGLPYAVFVYSGLVALGVLLRRARLGGAEPRPEPRPRHEDVLPALSSCRWRLALPGLVDLLVSLVVVGVFMAVYGVAPSAALVLLPFWIVACVVVVVAAGLWLSALNVQYRDVRHTMTFLLQVWLFASPVVYASSLVEGAWQYVYALNPMVTVLDGFRWSLVGGPAPGPEALVSLAVGRAMLAGGLVYFLRAERRFADLI